MLSSVLLILALILDDVPSRRAEIFRLPRKVLPTSYELQLEPHFAEDNFTLYGEVWIDLDVEETTSEIILHSEQLNIFEEEIHIKNISCMHTFTEPDISVDENKELKICCFSTKKEDLNASLIKKQLVANATNPREQIANDTEVMKEYTGENTFTNITVDSYRNILILSLSYPLQQGCKYQLYIKYLGKLSKTLTGFYTYSYKDLLQNKTKWLASTTFEPFRARKAFPCFDEPGFKSHFLVRLSRPRNLTALSNMPVKFTTTAESEGWVWDHFEQTPIMPAYLLAFFIGDFAETNCTNCSSHFTAWTRAHLAEQTHFALNMAPRLLTYFSNLFTISSPLPKHDLLALPSFAGNALENWGLISFEEKYLLYKEGVSPISTQERVANILSHELAHTWFGNLVTPKWWSDIWLNEGFATYFAALGVDHVKPEWDFLSVTAANAFITILSLDSLQSTTPLRPILTTDNDVLDIFNYISYYKGYYMLRMLSYALGEETFLRGIRSYIKHYAYGAVTQDDLWAILTDQARRDGVLQEDVHLTKLMAGWTDQEGYPTLNITRDYKKNIANLTQFRWMRTRTWKTTDGKLWWIPVTYTDQRSSDFSATAPKFWLGVRKKSIQNMPKSNEWVIFNIQASGLYRVNYDVHNWRLLSKFLLTSMEFENISLLNRALLLDDALNLARDGLLAYEVALNVTKYLHREQHYLPWKAALHNFNYLNSMLYLTDGQKKFQDYVLKLIEPQLEKLSLDVQENDSLCQNLHRKQILHWACQADHSICTDGANVFMKHWKLDSKRANIIPANLRSIVYCTAIKNGNGNDWNFLRQQLDITTIISERNSIIKALGCSRNLKILERFLNETILKEPTMKKNEQLTVFKAVALNKVGFSVAKKFLFNNMENIGKQFSSNTFFLLQLLEVVTERMNLPSDLQELNELQQRHAWLKRSRNTINQMEERIRFNIKWMEKNYNSICSWLTG